MTGPDLAPIDRGMRVLVVDDEVRLADGVRRGLEAEGWAVDVAHDGVDGLWHAREFGYDAIDPTAAILSVALLLDHIGRSDLAAAVTRAVEADLADRGTSQRRTAEIGDAIAAAATARTTTA